MVTHKKKRKKHPMVESWKIKKGVGPQKIYKDDWVSFQYQCHLLGAYMLNAYIQVNPN